MSLGWADQKHGDRRNHMDYYPHHSTSWQQDPESREPGLKNPEKESCVEWITIQCLEFLESSL